MPGMRFDELGKNALGATHRQLYQLTITSVVGSHIARSSGMAMLSEQCPDRGEVRSVRYERQPRDGLRMRRVLELREVGKHSYMRARVPSGSSWLRGPLMGAPPFLSTLGPIGDETPVGRRQLIDGSEAPQWNAATFVDDFVTASVRGMFPLPGDLDISTFLVFAADADDRLRYVECSATVPGVASDPLGAEAQHVLTMKMEFWDFDFSFEPVQKPFALRSLRGPEQFDWDVDPIAADDWKMDFLF